MVHQFTIFFNFFLDSIGSKSIGMNNVLEVSPSLLTALQSPTSGAHTHAHAHAHPYPRVLGGHGCDVIVHGWAWVGIGFVHPCIQLQIGVKLLGCREYAN
jgi:hypothetical protein